MQFREYIQKEATAYQFLMYSKSDSKNFHSNTTMSAVHAPVALDLFKVTRRNYLKTLELQPVWNVLMQKLSLSDSFIDLMMEKLDGVDDFCERLYLIEKKTRHLKKEMLSMGILRSDYLLHQEGERTSMKNVEVNTIASSFGFLATQLSEIYRNYLKENSSTGLNFVPSESSFQLVRAISQSMDQFQATYPGTSGPYESTIAVMLVQKNEKNTFDQEGLIQLLVNTYQKKMIRLDWQTFREKAALKDRTYYIDGIPVSLIYFRAGYQPQDYHFELDWDTRLEIELSNSIKCPSISLQLVGMKKAQQMITDKSLLAAYLPADAISLLQSCFMKIYDFENILNPQTASLLDAFRQKSYDQYILKPQREGGGNNLTGLEAIQFLEKLEKEGNLATILKGYILMEKIESPTQSNNLMRQNNVLSSQSIGELGIFGTILYQGDNLILNASCGYLLRVKDCSVAEGGVAAGFAHLGILGLEFD